MGGLGGEAFGFELFEARVGEDGRLHGRAAGFVGGILHGAGEGRDDAVHLVEALAEQRESAMRPVAAFVVDFHAEAERARGAE